MFDIDLACPSVLMSDLEKMSVWGGAEVRECLSERGFLFRFADAALGIRGELLKILLALRRGGEGSSLVP